MRLKADLHTHTSSSKDGLSSPRQLVAAAAAAGIDVLGVTDHNTLRGGLAAAAAARRSAPKLLVIPGIELRTASGDVLVFGVPHELPAGRPLSRIVAAVRSHRGFLIAPHPFDRLRRGVGPAAAPADAIEAFNARCWQRSRNAQAAAFAKARGLRGIAVSDSHRASELGSTYTVVDAKARTPAAVFAAIAAGRVELRCAPLSHASHLWASLAKHLR